METPMSEQREVVILSGVRTAIGDYGGSLKDIPPSELAARVVKEAVSRAKIDPKDVGQCVIGNVIHTEPKDMYISRLACVNGGLPHDTGALTLNRLCGSGLQAIVSAAQYVLLGDTDAAVAGGVESMSRGGYLVPSARWGARMGEAKMMDMMVGALTDPFDTVHMGITAENVAKKCEFTREQQDAFAVESHKRAAAATAAGHFKSQILPIELKSKKGPIQFDTDEHIRADAPSRGWASSGPCSSRRTARSPRATLRGSTMRPAAVVLMERIGRGEEGPQADGASDLLWPCGHRSHAHGPGTGVGGQACARQGGIEARADGRDRVERSVRRAGARRLEGARDGS
jgi:acetyl-CoA C-acetyltransferase